MTTADPILTVEDLRLSFSGVHALAGVSLRVPAGSIVAVIGPNGAGKSSLFNCISGHYRADSGRIVLAGRDVTQMPPYRIARLGVARMFQQVALFDGLSVLENLLLGRFHLTQASLLANLLRLPRMRREEAIQRRRAEEVMELVQLEVFRHVPVGGLPGSVRKRVELGRALCMEPQLLLLDEPAGGLDPRETEAMGRHFAHIRRELGVTQILIEHRLRFVMELADRIAVLDFGALIAEGAPDDVARDQRVIDAYIGGATARGAG